MLECITKVRFFKEGSKKIKLGKRKEKKEILSRDNKAVQCCMAYAKYSKRPVLPTAFKTFLPDQPKNLAAGEKVRPFIKYTQKG
jgi:hypothetical protein